MLQDLLENNGYAVDRVDRGEEAFDAITEAEPNLVLLDAHLQDINPFELRDRLKQSREQLDIPVIFMTTLDDDEVRVKGFESGDDLVTKPFDVREVLARVERQVTVSKVRMALRESEAKFRSVMESAIDAIISGDADGNIRSWNSAATALFGFTEAEVIGKPIELIIPERFRKSHQEGVQRVSAGGQTHVIGKTVELAAVRKDGTEFPVELSLATWFLDDRRYYTGIIRDIGERKRAEEALRKSEQALRARTQELKEKNAAMEVTLNQLNEMQAQLIMQEKMASLGKLSAGMAHELNNPAAAAQRGASQLELKFSQLQNIQLCIGAMELSRPQVDKLIALDHVIEERAQHPADLNALTRSDREEALEGWLTEKGIETASELVPSLVSLGYGQEDLEELAADFVPLQYSVVLDWLSCTHAIYSLIAEIGLGTGRIAEIVRALKTYTYMDQAPIQAVDIREGLENTLIIFQNKLKAGITVHREYADDLPAIQAYGSELNQVWTNIIDNAIDAMDGEGTLIVRARREAPWVVVEIEDDGRGIPEDIQSKIFDPFFTTKPLGEGSGLGLNISRNLVVQKHRGEISVRSEPGSTCFLVRLPIDFNPAE
jgi:PAS domain S-box-containing protein